MDGCGQKPGCLRCGPWPQLGPSGTAGALVPVPHSGCIMTVVTNEVRVHSGAAWCGLSTEVGSDTADDVALPLLFP